MAFLLALVGEPNRAGLAAAVLDVRGSGRGDEAAATSPGGTDRSSCSLLIAEGFRIGI